MRSFHKKIGSKFKGAGSPGRNERHHATQQDSGLPSGEKKASISIDGTEGSGCKGEKHAKHGSIKG